jgi:hypothetical protein
MSNHVLVIRGCQPQENQAEHKRDEGDRTRPTLSRLIDHLHRCDVDQLNDRVSYSDLLNPADLRLACLITRNRAGQLLQWRLLCTARQPLIASSADDVITPDVRSFKVADHAATVFARRGHCSRSDPHPRQNHREPSHIDLLQVSRHPRGRVPTRKPFTPALTPIPDFERFSLTTGAILNDFRNVHPIAAPTLPDCWKHCEDRRRGVQVKSAGRYSSPRQFVSPDLSRLRLNLPKPTSLHWPPLNVGAIRQPGGFV